MSDKIVLKEKDFLDILDGNSEVFEEIENKLTEVDDHGDSTYRLIVQCIKTKKFYKNYYIVQKQWGIMEEDEYVFTLTVPTDKVIQVWS